MELKVFKPYSFLYHFYDPLGVYFTLIKGSNSAIVFDTGYGFINIRKTIENEIDTPYIVINSHGHMDHSCGNYLFDKVFISEEDYNLCLNHNGVERRKLNILNAYKFGLLNDTFDKLKYQNYGPGNLQILTDNIFDLGNLHIEVIKMPGHTHGSIGLLIKEAKLLLTADAATPIIWLFLEESTSRKEYINMLNEVKKLAFDNFLPGHNNKIYPKRYFDYFIEVANKANRNNSKLVNFEGFSKHNTYQYLAKYEDDLVGICYCDV